MGSAALLNSGAAGPGAHGIAGVAQLRCRRTWRTGDCRRCSTPVPPDLAHMGLLALLNPGATWSQRLPLALPAGSSARSAVKSLRHVMVGAAGGLGSSDRRFVRAVSVRARRSRPPSLGEPLVVPRPWGRNDWAGTGRQGGHVGAGNRERFGSVRVRAGHRRRDHRRGSLGAAPASRRGAGPADAFRVRAGRRGTRRRGRGGRGLRAGPLHGSAGGYRHRQGSGRGARGGGRSGREPGGAGVRCPAPARRHRAQRARRPPGRGLLGLVPLRRRSTRFAGRSAERYHPPGWRLGGRSSPQPRRSLRSPPSR